MIVDQNRYRIAAELGRGGMGIIYQAHDMLLDRDVAMKVISGDITEESRRHLLHEAKAAARLNHPNIVSIFDAGEIQGQPFIVMELIDGVPLLTHRPASLPEIVDLAVQICAALDHAHANGIVHRDLKPENIVVNSQGRVKLLDFGLARSLASRLSGQGMVVGTVFYLAPEQALGKEADARADLYSLGVILYELVAGQLPFVGDDPLMVISQHLYAPAVPPSTHRAEALPLEPVILRLLAKNPEDRYSSAAEVAAQLKSLNLDEGALPQISPARARVEPEAGRENSPAATGALLDQLARGRMVGRRSELNRLRELWERSLQGNGHLALISGEPGIGKTRLCREMIVHAQLSGAVVLRGGCYEYEAATPYLPFVEALREWVHLQSPEKLRRSLENTASELSRLAPEIENKLGPQPPNPPLPPNEERLRLFDHFSRFLDHLAEDRGLLLFIDDLHWADQGTLSLLYYVLRDLRNERILVIAAYREIELDRAHPLAASLVEWNRERIATRIPLDRLSYEDTATHLATLFGQETVSEDLARAMYAETEGNPFFLEEVVKALIEQGQIYRENNEWERKEIAELAIPQSVKEAIGRRLNRLSQDCIDVLHIAAALGKEFKFFELAAASSFSEDRLLDSLDEASETQLIHAEGRDSFLFSHDKIREVLYEELNPIRRKRLHQRIGEGLEKIYSANLEGYAQELAHHFTESGDLPRSLRYSLLAADQTRQLFALDDALHYFDHAREAAEALDQNETLSEIHNSIGEVYSITGPLSKSVENFELALGYTQDPHRRAAIKARAGREYAAIGDERGIQFIEEALQELDVNTQANEVALATAMLGRYFHYRAIHTRAIEYLEKALALAEPLDDPEILLFIYAYMAGANQHLTHYQISNEWARKNIAMGERKQAPQSVAIGYEFLAENAIAVGEWKDAIQYADRDREIGEKTGAKDRVAWGLYSRGYAEQINGDMEASERDSRSSRILALEIEDTRLAIMAGIIQMQDLSNMGREEEANELAQETLKITNELQHPTLHAQTHHGIAYLHVNRDDYQQALDHLLQAEDHILPTENAWMPMNYRPLLVHVLIELDRIAEAEKMIPPMLAASRQAGSRYCEGQGLRAQSELFARLGRWENVFEAIDRSIHLLRDQEDRLELGHSYQQRGLFHQAQGDVQSARDSWQRAAVLFSACGAVALEKKVHRLLDQTR
ncbi:MAG TPA: AAA family ATPase [Anaerolineaceae bacterium]|nr:AAA family ATPase [Anaerolineaceae bacterium]